MQDIDYLADNYLWKWIDRLMRSCVFSFQFLIFKMVYFVLFYKSAFLSRSDNWLICPVQKIGYFVSFGSGCFVAHPPELPLEVSGSTKFQR